MDCPQGPVHGCSGLYENKKEIVYYLFNTSFYYFKMCHLCLYVQIVAAIMAITGIVMMAYADGFHGDSFVGVALAVGSASTSALYKVRLPHKSVPV